MNEAKLFIVIPCYNEEAVLPITSPLFLGQLNELIQKKKISQDSRILFVNDGSTDSTWKIIEDLSVLDEHYIGISQSRNRGHQNAVVAGLMECRGKADIIISVDCDGQDDIRAMEKMVDAYYEGAQIVYGVRNQRDTDTFFKRVTAEGYYKVLHLLGANIVYNHADYRLISAKVLEAFEDYKEVNLFLRGIFPLIGFKTANVYYDRKERLAGKTHYSLKRMLGLAWDGVTSLTIKPLCMIMNFGMIVSTLSFIGVIWAVVTRLMGNTVGGWASMTCIICFIGGIQLISIGIIGEYIGKIYMEIKHRPRYIISERTWKDENMHDGSK